MGVVVYAPDLPVDSPGFEFPMRLSHSKTVGPGRNVHRSEFGQRWRVRADKGVFTILVPLSVKSSSENPESGLTVPGSDYVFLTLWSFCSLPLALRFAPSQKHVHLSLALRSKLACALL